jgi:hypothetical protein
VSRTLDDIVDLIGIQPTIELVRRYGGRMIRIPVKVGAEHAITLCVGFAASEKLAAVYGGEDLRVPAERNLLIRLRNEQIVKRYTAPAPGNWSVNALSIEYGIDRKMIYNVLEQAGVKAPE